MVRRHSEPAGTSAPPLARTRDPHATVPLIDRPAPAPPLRNAAGIGAATLARRPVQDPPAHTSSSGPPRESRTQGTEALIFAEDGRNLHVGRSTDSKVILKLPAYSRVFVVDHDAGGGWSKVTTSDGHQGFVSTSVVKTDLPCPGARLYKVPKERTALGIAGQFFGKDEVKGHDGRYFVNVLAYLNPNSLVEQTDNWKDVKFKAGFTIWIPTNEFAQTLKGKVGDGSITNGLFAEAKEIVDDAIDIVVGGAAFAAGLLEGIVLELKDDIVGLVDIVGELGHVLKSAFTGNLLSDLKGLWKEITSLDLKALLKAFWDKWNAHDPWDRWRFRGEVIGRVGVEVALLFLTDGVSAVLATRFAKLAEAIRTLPFADKLADAGKTAKLKLGRSVDALKTKLKGKRDPKDIAAQKTSHAKNTAKPGSGTPSAKPWKGRVVGKGQNQLVKDRIQDAIAKEGATDIRVDQQMVGAAQKGQKVGDKLGVNRPDLQYTDRAGRRHYVEWDSLESDRGPGHLKRLLANDPHGLVELWQEVSPGHYVKVYPLF